MAKHKFKILIVDDDIYWSETLINYTQQVSKHLFYHAKNIDDAVRQLKYQNFDLALIDVDLNNTRTNGLNLLALYRNKLSCLIITGGELQELEVRGYNRDILIPKQFGPKFLLNRVNKELKNIEGKMMSTKAETARRVLLIHGRCTKLVSSIRVLLELAGLEVLEWEELIQNTLNPAATNLQAVKNAFSAVQAAVVLINPEEEVHLIDILGSGEAGQQPRPNVIFEAGMALGLFGNRTIFVQVGTVRIWSDIDGINRIQFDGSVDKRKTVIDRLKLAGCKVRENANLYLTTPLDFDTCL